MPISRNPRDRSLYNGVGGGRGEGGTCPHTRAGGRCRRPGYRVCPVPQPVAYGESAVSPVAGPPRRDGPRLSGQPGTDALPLSAPDLASAAIPPAVAGVSRRPQLSVPAAGLRRRHGALRTKRTKKELQTFNISFRARAVIKPATVSIRLKNCDIRRFNCYRRAANSVPLSDLSGSLRS